MSGSYHASVNVIYFESCVLYSGDVILCCVGGSFPWRFMGRGGRPLSIMLAFFRHFLGKRAFFFVFS